MYNQDKKYSILKLIAVIYRLLSPVILIAAIGAMIVLDTSWIIDVGLILFALIAGITLFAIAELIKLFISNEQGIRKTNVLLRNLLNETEGKSIED